MPLPDNITTVDFGLTLALLIVIYKGLDLAKQLYLNKKAPGPTIATLACQTDPMHFQRIKEIHQMTADTEKSKLAGNFQCQFKSRDEVRDLMEIMKQNVTAAKEVAREVRALTAEMRLTRNGKGKV